MKGKSYTTEGKKQAKADLKFQKNDNTRRKKKENTYGETTTKLNINAVLNQLMAVSDTPKYSAELVDTGAKLNHYTKKSAFHPTPSITQFTTSYPKIARDNVSKDKEKR